MKKIFILGLLALSNSAFSEDQESVSNLLKHTDREMLIELNEKTVRCLVGDYGASSLKISIPQLRSITMFRHTTRGEVQPCISAGACMEGRNPIDVIKPGQPTERVSVSVDLYEVLNINHKLKTCDRHLFEKVVSKVRGIGFEHEDYGTLGATNYEACLKLKETAGK